MTDALELDALWEDFHRVVNMTSQELAGWLRVSDAQEDSEPLPDRAAHRPGSTSSRSSRNDARTSRTPTSRSCTTSWTP